MSKWELMIWVGVIAFLLGLVVGVTWFERNKP